MTVYGVRLRMAQGGGAWPLLFKYSYQFFVDTPDAPTAAVKGLEIWEMIKSCHLQWCYCYSVYVSDLNPLTTDYIEQPVPAGDQRGTLGDTVSANAYNPTVCYRLDMTVASSRPSRKFLRLGLVEDNVNPGGESVQSAITTAVTTAFGNLLLAGVDYLVDNDGQDVIGMVPKGVTTRRLGREAREGVPSPPAFG